MPRSCTPPESLVVAFSSCTVGDGAGGSAATKETPLADHAMSTPVIAIMLHDLIGSPTLIVHLRDET